MGTAPDHHDSVPLLKEMRFGASYRLTIVLEPSGVVRDVIQVEGVENWDPRAFVGRHVADVAEGGVRPWRRQTWVERIAAAQDLREPVCHMDHRQDQPLTDEPMVEYLLTPIRDGSGRLESLLLQLVDRTDRWNADALARAQRDQLATALELTGLGSYSLHLREPRMDADEGWRRIYGVPDPQELVEAEGYEGLWRFIHDDDRPSVERALEVAILDDVDYVADFRIWSQRAGGPELRWIEALGRVQYDAQGLWRVLGVIEDVTDRRREEESRLLVQKREAIGTLAGGIAHDFNNVISAIMSNAAVAERELLDGRSAATSIHEIQRASLRAADLVRRLLVFGRQDPTEQVSFDLAAVVEEACALLRPTLPAGIELIERVDLPLPLAFGDSSQLHQVVINLISNAGHAIRSQGSTGTIEVLLGLEPGADGDGREQLRLRVVDSGPGVPEHIAQQVFDPFFTTKPAGTGTGLGLTAVQTIVRRHGGTIAIGDDGDDGGGGVFTILLPVTSDASDAGEEPVERPEERPATLRVLFVDDEPALARLADRAFSVHGCRATVFTDPRAALEAFRAAPEDFDVLITDLSMPPMDGIELAAAIRELRPALPVVLSSGYLTDETRAAATAQGIGRIVPKPCSIEDVVQAARELIAEQAESGDGG